MSKEPVRDDPTSAGPLSPLDVLRCGLFGLPGRSNRACPLRDLGGARPARPTLDFTLSGLYPRPIRTAWVARRGLRLSVAAAVQWRSGPKSWEIVDLYVNDGGDSPTSVLDGLARSAASRGGEAIFLRLALEDRLIDTARLSGFFPCLPETLFSRRPDSSAHHNSTPCPPAGVRHRTAVDDHELFRLYSASTPAAVRHVAGMTFDRWQSSRERFAYDSDEWVLEDGGAIVGSLRRTLRDGTALFAVEVHPNHAEGAAALVDFVLHDASAEELRCLVGEHQVGLGSLLIERKFDPVGEFITLVKKTVVSARDDSRVGATIAC